MKRVVALCCVLGTLLGGVAFAQAPADSETLNQIKATGEVRIGVRSNASMLSEFNKGDPKGYVVDLCREISKDIEREVGKPLKLRFVEVTPVNRFELLDKGDIHMECGVTTVTEDRLKKVEFSLNTFITSTNFLTLKKNEMQGDVNLYQPLIGQKVAVMEGTPHEKMLVQWMNGQKLTFVQVKSIEEGIQKVQEGTAFAFVQDRFLIETILNNGKYNVDDFAFSKAKLSVEPYSIALKKGDGVFKKLVNRSLREIYAKGLAEKMLTRWLQQKKLQVNELTKEILMRPSTSSAIQG